jgi:hypothetical protein
LYKENRVSVPPVGSKESKATMNRSMRSAEKEEVEVVLSSSLFVRSKLHSRLLRYLAEHYFSDSQEHLKEYTIAVEALDRPESFDSRADSSVRVMMHRLRARINEFYEGEGKDHQTRIILDDGRYTLQFSHRPDSAEEPLPIPSDKDLIQSIEPAEQPDPSEPLQALIAEPRQSYPLGRHSRGWLAPSAVIVFLLIVLVFAPRFFRRDNASPRTSGNHESLASPAPTMESDGGAIRILCGNLEDSYLDREGHYWQKDHFFSGGTPVQQQFSYLQGSNDPGIYKHARTGPSQYNIPAPNRPYELHLHFSEVHFGPATDPVKMDTSRLFDILLNHKVIFDQLDILSSAGGDHRALVRVVRDVYPDNDGMIHLDFAHRIDQPLINAIELIPQDSGTPKPIRIVTQPNSITDDKGVYWGMDKYYLGGTSFDRHNFPDKTVQSNLYDGERYGHFAYQIPVAPGCYSLKLHFIERHFGQKLDSPFEDLTHNLDGRLFDILANDRVLKKDVNIVRAAGGPNKPFALEFHNIPSNLYGQILLQFNPTRGYAFVNAIEVTYQDAQCK